MIKIEHLETCGWEASIRGMRNPKNSWDKSDTLMDYGSDYKHTKNIVGGDGGDPYYSGPFMPTGNGSIAICLGPNDADLMKRLRDGGPVHAKFRRMVTVYCDITAPLYWWSEYDTYKVGTVANSCSKMHKLLSKPFEISDFSFDKLPGFKNEIRQFVPEIIEDDLDEELWISCDRDYEVSTCGRVRHTLTSGKKRIVSGIKTHDGYLMVNIHGELCRIHQLVGEFLMPQTYQEGYVINHKDGNKLNNRIENLEWVSQKENIEHSYANHFQPNPVLTYKGKFTQEQRNEIKRLWDEGIMSKRQIAKKYGVSHACICDIINDKYKYINNINIYEKVAKPLVDMLNELRDTYLMTDDETTKKKIWYTIIQLLPSSYNQKRTVELNYEVLAGIYKWRKDHKLDEWREFCRVMKEELPESWIFTGEEE